jgi:methylated-DNA-[protein]-cysteine S-methyltransferase
VVRDLQRLTVKRRITEGTPMPSLQAQKQAIRFLKRFFAGEGRTVAVPLDLSGTTLFQRKVWQAARSIPYGETRSYGWIAKRIGKPKAARAVGQAMGANPVPILVP